MTVGPAYFQIPKNKIERCINSGLCASNMIMTHEVVLCTSKYIFNDITPYATVASLYLPFMGARYFQRIFPDSDDTAIYLGAALGMSTAILLGLGQEGYALGILVGGLTASGLAAAKVRVLRPLSQAS
jgi:hypothetical protein